MNHGGGWFSVCLHMDRIDVHLGQQVASGEPVGRLGLAGTEEAHLHYEQLYDTTAQGHRLRPVQEVGRRGTGRRGVQPLVAADRLDEVTPGGRGRAYVSAYYLDRWGNDEVKHNDGWDIPACT
ncbi:peptidoglycan DD-metalloendopeptidase family protein [Streptomyces hokutonensis]|uniref:Peptidoglycan DD-metalloendopeptidase family protein n=1 Tax=Streptomyces hokutonensis TaxID=1306990 RepID=A0ABW6MG93_9ACTN